MNTHRLWEYFIEQHDMILVESELNEVVGIVQKEEKYCGSCGEPKAKKHKFWCERAKVN